MPKPNIELNEEYTPRRVAGGVRDIEALAGADCYCTPEQRAAVVPADRTCDVLTCEPCAARSVINGIVTFKFPE